MWFALYGLFLLGRFCCRIQVILVSAQDLSSWGWVLLTGNPCTILVFVFLHVCCVHAHIIIIHSFCAIFTMCNCSFSFIYRFQEGLNKSHVEKIISSFMICFTCHVDNVLNSPTGFWTTICQSELNFQTFQSPKNFGSRPC